MLVVTELTSSTVSVLEVIQTLQQPHTLLASRRRTHFHGRPREARSSRKVPRRARTLFRARPGKKTILAVGIRSFTNDAADASARKAE